MAKFGQGGAKIAQGGAKNFLRASRANKTRFARDYNALRAKIHARRFFVPKNLAPPLAKIL